MLMLTKLVEEKGGGRGWWGKEWMGIAVVRIIGGQCIE